MAIIDQSGLKGKTRDRPISSELEAVLKKAAAASGVDIVYVTSGGQPGTTGQSTGSTRHNGGRAADLHLGVGDSTPTFSDTDADPIVKKFVTACAAYGATGIGAGLNYMGNKTLHIGFGLTPTDKSMIVWGADGKSANAPQWLRDAAQAGWKKPPTWVFQTDSEVTEDLPEDQDVVFGPEHDYGAVALTIPQGFNIEVINAAQATQRQWGIPASITLAQWALESSYGSRMPAGSNNPFGIKAVEGDAFVEAWTTEYIGGKEKKVRQKFRVFPNLEAAFIRHGKLLGTSQYYAKARNYLSDPDRFADALTGVYATDPKYGTLLKSIMRSKNLYSFNLASGSDTLIDPHMEGDMGEPLHQGVADSVGTTTLQTKLTALGYKLGKIDGKFGPLTTGALLAFQNDNGLPTTGVLDALTEATLNKAEPRRLDDSRRTATEKDIAEGGSRTMINARRGRLLGWISAAFGALGIGNSAILNAAPDAATAPVASIPPGLLQLLADVEKLSATTNGTELTRLADAARTISSQLGNTALPPEVIQILEQLRSALPAPMLTANPQLANLLAQLGQPGVGQTEQLRTIFDILPTFFANGTALETLTQGIATAGASILPGFGGSLAVLGIGIISNLLSNRIAAARLDDYRTGGNINPQK
jgi:hypothetical protein